MMWGRSNVGTYAESYYVNEGQREQWMTDAAGRLVRAIGRTNSVVDITYTAPNTTTHVPPGLVNTVSAPEGTVSYAYDRLGRRTQMTAVSNSVSYTYNTKGLVNTISFSGNTFAFSYDGAGRRTGVSYPNGRGASYAYNAVGELAGIVYNGVESIGYTYDTRGLVNSMSRDGVDPLLPAMGNMVTSDSSNRITSFGGAGLSYNNNGDLTAWGDKGYQWNSAGQMTGVTNSGATVATFEYDALGRRVKATINGVVTRYVYDGSAIVAELEGNGVLRAWYVHGPGVDEPLARISNTGDVRYYHADILGSVVALTNSAGVVTTRYNYDPYGRTQVVSTTDTFTQPFQFTGRENDGATGLYYYRARYYSPTLKRFITEDPLRFNAGDVNWYAYVGGSPTNFRDPSGLYGADVHLGDTYNLARAVGFSHGTAFLIASEDNNVDLNFSTMPTAPWGIDWHFMSAEKAEQMLKLAIKERSHILFAKALHAYQDSFSHYCEGYRTTTGILFPGHFPGTDTDIYYPNSTRDSNMHEGTKAWLQKYRDRLRE